MLTTMTEEDWTIVLKVFEASRSRRGDKGRDDGRFLEALSISWFTTSLGGLCRKSLGIGTASAVAVLALEPVWNFRSLLRCAGGNERDGASGARCSIPPWYAPMSRRRARKGVGRSGADTRAPRR